MQQREGIPADGGGGNTSGTFPENFDPNLLYNGLGGKPLKEYNNPCAGVDEMWNNYPENEVHGYLTSDGKLITTNVLSFSGGEMRGVYPYRNPLTSVTQYYYTYPMSQGPPTQSYSGIKDNGQFYFIPVVASIHTHTPCRIDGTNGVSHDVSAEDKAFATKYPGLRNWVVGCNAIAQFNDSDNFFNVTTGPLSNTCSSIN